MSNLIWSFFCASSNSKGFFQCKNSYLLEKQYGGSRNPLIVVGSKSFGSVSILFNFPKWIFESVVCLHTQLAKVSPFKFVMLQVFPTFNSICLASEIASFHQFSLVFIQKKIWILLIWVPLYIIGNYSFCTKPIFVRLYTYHLC